MAGLVNAGLAISGPVIAFHKTDNFGKEARPGSGNRPRMAGFFMGKAED
ncbi:MULTISPECIES: hypothetical protein [Marinobacter]|uniref:Uncharacterized protein n=1 Tax=Marinobacter alkaliphilus TaxID=254719 RepID=A0ABZ3E3Y5_9GAMM|nr:MULTISPECIES: hypothetical protein [Marinobacter]